MAPTLYALKGFSENPNADINVGVGLSTAIIYAESSESDNFPVKGYMAGGTKSIWSVNSCSAPDFGKDGSTYEQIFISPESNAFVGIVARIELDITSCNKEQISTISNLVGANGIGSDDTGDDLKLRPGTEEYMEDGSVSMMDLS